MKATFSVRELRTAAWELASSTWIASYSLGYQKKENVCQKHIQATSQTGDEQGRFILDANERDDMVQLLGVCAKLRLSGSFLGILMRLGASKVHRKKALLYLAFTSPRVHGEWQMAPGDGGVARLWHWSRWGSEVLIAIIFWNSSWNLRIFIAWLRDFEKSDLKVDPKSCCVAWWKLSSGQQAFHIVIPCQNDKRCKRHGEDEHVERWHFSLCTLPTQTLQLPVVFGNP